MFRNLHRTIRVAASCLLAAGLACAETTAIEGIVKGQDGSPKKDVLVKIVRKDIKGNYEVKTKKKGDYYYGGLPLGEYRVSVVEDGKELDFVDKVKTRLGDPVDINFNLKEVAAKSQAASAAPIGNGQPVLSKEQERSMSPAEKAAFEKANKQRAAEMSKHKELNDAFNQGMEAAKAKQYDAAIEAFNKAAEMDPKQLAVWGMMAETYVEMSKTKTGADQDATLEKGLAAYQKALELNPNDASYHNNYALALARAKKIPEMQAELSKAVELDPQGAGRYYYNMGAVLTNANQNTPACEAFQKAIAADQSYADAYYQYGICLTGKATNTADGKLVFPEGTAEAFQKYIELKPDGPNAQSAKDMLQTMGETITTKYVAPGAQKNNTAIKKKK